MPSYGAVGGGARREARQQGFNLRAVVGFRPREACGEPASPWLASSPSPFFLLFVLVVSTRCRHSCEQACGQCVSGRNDRRHALAF